MNPRTRPRKNTADLLSYHAGEKIRCGSDTDYVGILYATIILSITFNIAIRLILIIGENLESLSIETKKAERGEGLGKGMKV